VNAEHLPPAPSLDMMTSWLGFPDTAPRLREAYERLARARGLEARPPRSLDRALDRLASWGRPGLALADAFAARFRKRGPLRRRLILVLALLEADPDAGEVLDTPLSRGPAGAVFRGVIEAVGHVLLLLASIPPMAVLAGWESATGGRGG